MAAADPLVDSFGRPHADLRVSVTDRCNLRCFYCMADAGVAFKPHDAILRFEEIERLVRVAARLGIRRVRLTGGEPLVRKGVVRLVEMLAAVPGIDELAMTTNGILLAQHADSLRAAGLRRLNISLDSLDPRRFLAITHSDQLPQVLAGIDAARRAGFHPIKLNVVAIRGRTEPDVVPLARFALERGLEIRFIEFMPLDAGDRWRADMVLPAAEVLRLLAEGIGPLEPVVEPGSHAAATHYRWGQLSSTGVSPVAAGSTGVLPVSQPNASETPTPLGEGTAPPDPTIGLVRTVSQPFCDRCGRLRLTADGKLRNCLFSREEWDAGSLLRGGGTNEQLAAMFRTAVRAKKRRRGTDAGALAPTDRPMHQIGG